MAKKETVKDALEAELTNEEWVNVTLDSESENLFIIKEDETEKGKVIEVAQPIGGFGVMIETILVNPDEKLDDELLDSRTISDSVIQQKQQGENTIYRVKSLN